MYPIFETNFVNKCETVNFIDPNLKVKYIFRRSSVYTREGGTVRSVEAGNRDFTVSGGCQSCHRDLPLDFQ